MPLNYGDQISPYGQDPTAPLAMRMMEHLPGITASIGFSSMRGSNTLIRGGYFDDARQTARRAKYGVFNKGSTTATPITKKSFLFGKRRFADDAAARAAGKDMFIKSSVLNNTPRLRNLSRFHSLSVFTAQEKSGLYTYAQGHRLLNKMKFEGLRKSAGIAEGTTLFGPGMIAAISAGTKLDRLAAAGKLTGSSLEQTLLNVKRLAEANNKGLFMMNYATISPAGMSSAAMGGAAPAGMTFFDEAASSLRASGGASRGVAGNLMASSLAGEGTRYLAGYFRGAQGFAGAAGLEGKALLGAQNAVAHMQKALGTAGITGKSGAKYVGLEGAERLLAGNAFRELGVKGAFKTFGTSAGAKVLGARAAALAIPGLQFVAAASLVYDIAKMGGEVVKSGINLARDASKSLQGSINKPMFGMGYRDTELAATSRARGVMAIQNSRLNARSVLGSEASMMAAHFG